MDRGESVTLEIVVTSGAAGLLAGAASGLVWGGIGGRIAMRVLFLTSNDTVKGIVSDDGFEIGRICASTIILLIGTAFAGGALGLVYGLGRLLARGPTLVLAAAVAVATGSFLGGAIVSAEGIDFRFLTPLWLAVGLFVLLPALWGATLVLLTDRLLRSEAVFAMSQPRLDRRFLGGVAGWLILLVLTTVGLVELANDLSELT